MRSTLTECRRIVIKVGTSTLTHDTGRLHIERMEKLVRQIADLANQGKEVILVSSGAIAAGLPALGFTEKPKDIPKRQAAASVGQGLLLHMYEKLFREYGIVVGQILLTRDDSDVKKRFVNMRNALLALLELRVVPIVNENDVVGIDEVKIGDNDTLSAIVASVVEADLLIILSDIDGLYTDNPQVNPQATLIHEVESLTPAIWNLAGDAGTKRGTGGMRTKLDAANIATRSGVKMLIAAGHREGILRQILSGDVVGTYFHAHSFINHMKKRWMAFGSRLKGKIVVDDGCASALVKQGTSILPVGVIAVHGTFNEGETISVFHRDEEIARGIVNFSSTEIDLIKGLHTDVIADVLSVGTTYDEVVHRNNLVLLTHDIDSKEAF